MPPVTVTLCSSQYPSTPPPTTSPPLTVEPGAGVPSAGHLLGVAAAVGASAPINPAAAASAAAAAIHLRNPSILPPPLRAGVAAVDGVAGRVEAERAQDHGAAR